MEGNCFENSRREFLTRDLTFCPSILTSRRGRGAEFDSGESALDTDREGHRTSQVSKRLLHQRKTFEAVGILRTGEPATVGMGGWLTTDAFDTISERMSKELRKRGTLMVFLLALHGGNGVTGVPRPEAEICRKVRRVVKKRPIMVTAGPSCE